MSARVVKVTAAAATLLFDGGQRYVVPWEDLAKGAASPDSKTAAAVGALLEEARRMRRRLILGDALVFNLAAERAWRARAKGESRTAGAR